jgi:hypothetical protein
MDKKTKRPNLSGEEDPELLGLHKRPKRNRLEQPTCLNLIYLFILFFLRAI